MKTQKQTFTIVSTLALALLFFAGRAGAAGSEPDMRTSTSTQGQLGASDSHHSKAVTSYDEQEALAGSGERQGSSRGSAAKDSSTAAARVTSTSVFTEFWVYDSAVELYFDSDRDGFYYGVDLRFDVDTLYNVAEVYAVIYLSLDFGPWNEYAVTDDFTIYGSSGDDEYFVDTELLSGYPTGSYDILIEIFDAYEGVLVASFGPEDSSELSFLPLEDAGRDQPVSTTVIVNEGGGGALSHLSMLALLVLCVSSLLYRRIQVSLATTGSRRAVRITLRPQAARPSK